MAITPTNATSTIRITLHVGASSAGNVGAGLFVDTTAAALNADGARVEGATDMVDLVIKHTESAASTTARTYRVRLGPDAGGPANALLNGNGGSRLFGGVMTSSIEVEDILPQ